MDFFVELVGFLSSRRLARLVVEDADLIERVFERVLPGETCEFLLLFNDEELLFELAEADRLLVGVNRLDTIDNNSFRRLKNPRSSSGISSRADDTIVSLSLVAVLGRFKLSMKENCCPLC